MKIEYFLIFVTLFTCVICKIKIDISCGSNSSDVTVKYSGIDVKVITDHEIECFGIEKRNLKEALKKHFGKDPNSFYLKSPTPWNDLYEQYQWEQVSRVLSIKTAKVLGVTKIPVIVMSQDFDNLSNKTIKVNTGISQSVENTLTTSWSKNNEIIVSQELEYDVNVLFGKMKGTTGFSFSSSWGKSEEKSESITVGTSNSVETELQPGQAATAVLSANRGYIEVEIIYKAILRGNVAVNFKKLHKGHHFWGPLIDNVMKSAGIQNEVTAKESIKVGFYSDASLKVFDKVSGRPL